LAGYADLNYAQLRINLDRKADEILIKQWPDWVAQLINGRSVQYILGHTAFYDSEFLVDERVLIPRPETEELVEWILKDYSTSDNLKVLDLGTGSGAIGLTLKKHKPNWDLTLSDISKDALIVAKKNAFNLKLDVNFILSDVWQNLQNNFDLIVSNPPYIDFKNDEIDDVVLNNEPKIALFANDNGMEIYKKILSGAHKNQTLYFEIGNKQANSILKLASNSIIRRDLNGKVRMVKIKL
jgi:release factor glutamine methyltransferase